MKYKVRFIQPSFPDGAALLADYNAIIRNNWYTNFGPFENEFRSKVESYIGSGVQASTVANATLGLILAIKHSIVSDGSAKKILIPSFTFAAGAEAILWNGLEPVFFDIDMQNIQPSIDSARNYISEHGGEVAGILLCNTLGVGNPQIDQWEKLARDSRLPLIIDSAAGFGSEYIDGTMVGSRGDCEVFSFHATKSFGIGEGGAVVSRNPDLISNVMSGQNFGFNTDKEVSSLGLNAKLEEVNAAIGIRKFKENESSLKKGILIEYKKRLMPLGFSFQNNDDKSSLGFVTTIAPNPESAVKLLALLEENLIEAKNYYNPPLHRHKLFKEYERADDLSRTTDLCQRVVSLPCHKGVSKPVLDKIEICAKKSTLL